MEGIKVPRPKRTDFESQLQKVENQIKESEEKLKSLREEKESILQAKKEYELEQLYRVAKSHGKTIPDIIAELEAQKNSKNTK